MQAATLVRQMQAEKLALIKQMRKVNAENRRLKQIVGELRLSTSLSEMSELKQLNCSSRFMLS
jgi:transposase-like protein